ncbi:MAG: hypothetical protein EBR82_60375 [Caulobacteraceae bacterium]|nr:hypothetical protein [Caulobacteraceae bacterium]
MDTKTFLTSKTLWVNFLAFIVMAVQLKTGWVISPEIQAMALTAVNAVLRLVTKAPVSWS